jgi:hypothetical protein
MTADMPPEDREVSPRDEAAGQAAPLPGRAERLRAVGVLLADPEALGDDVLESCLYILRDRLGQQPGVGG